MDKYTMSNNTISTQLAVFDKLATITMPFIKGVKEDAFLKVLRKLISEGKVQCELAETGDELIFKYNNKN